MRDAAGGDEAALGLYVYLLVADVEVALPLLEVSYLLVGVAVGRRGEAGIDRVDHHHALLPRHEYLAVAPGNRFEPGRVLPLNDLSHLGSG